MENLQTYKKRDEQYIVAVQLDLDTDGFCYQKWGGEQCCKRGDWVVNNNGDIYTIDAGVFANTYIKTGPGQYIKTTRVWATKATKPGAIKTKEGLSSYTTGDYLVYNDPAGNDGYCMNAEKFESMYLRIE